MAQLSQATKNLISQYQSGNKLALPKEGGTTIHVDEVAARVAAFYEKIRGIIDWREEHLLKRGAIERMLKRRFFVGVDLLKEESTKESIAEPLILELVRGGHYPNDAIPETKFAEVQNIIDKYIFILKNTPRAEDGHEAMRFYNWLLSITACEIEEALSSSYKERALIDYMFELMKERIIVNEGALALRPLKEEEKNIQIYIAVQRALFKLDASVISYHLLKYKYPHWRNIDKSELLEIAKNILQTKKKIERSLNHLLSDKFYQVCERYDTPYLLLGDIISQDPQKGNEIVSNPEVLESQIRDSYSKRVNTLKARLGRAAVYATLSIFITKITMALAIEIPIDKYLTNEFNIFALVMNIIIPPLLMFLLVSTIRVPGRENMEKAVLETMKIIHETDKKDSYEIKTFKSGKNLAIRSFVDLIYFITFILTIGVIIFALSSLDFLSYLLLSSFSLFP